MRRRSMARRPNLFDSSAFFDFFASGGGIDIAENARMQRKELEGRKCLVWQPTSGWNANGIARFPFEVKGDIKISFDVYNTAAKRSGGISAELRSGSSKSLMCEAIKGWQHREMIIRNADIIGLHLAYPSDPDFIYVVENSIRIERI